MRPIKRKCNHPGCDRLIESGRFCESHKGDVWQKHGKAHTYGGDWARRRAYVMARDEYLCQPCLKAGRVTQAAHVDHIIPVAEGGTDGLDNLQAICESCHKVKTQEEAKRGRRRG